MDVVLPAQAGGEALLPDPATGNAWRPITLLQPGRIIFGDGCVTEFIAHCAAVELKNALVISSSTIETTSVSISARLREAGINTYPYIGIDTEPTVAIFHECLAAAQRQSIDAVIGIGGGSVLDVAKLVAALLRDEMPIEQAFGMDQLRRREIFLACLPTTAGTGSEVSPNAILLDESSRLKKAVISPHLVPDVACVDPLLTHTVPPAVTAATGIDALTHCIEAYANRFAHPMVDLFALRGVELIAENLLDAVRDGGNAQARGALALGSLYGGLCLGPVNTAGVHALAYPLGSQFHIAHGVSNAVMLPHVLRFNLSAAPDRYARLAGALAARTEINSAAAAAGIDRVIEILNQCPIPQRLSQLGIPRDAVPGLAGSAMTVTRLLKNNLRPISEEDAIQIYRAAF